MRTFFPWSSISEPVSLGKSKWVGGEKKEERRAKVAGTHVIADGKFQLSGISGKVTGER